MSRFIEEDKYMKIPVEGLKTLYISSKNYRISVREGSGPQLEMRFHNSRFRRLNVRQSGSSLYLEEEMAVTVYEFFRFMELVRSNLLEIAVPAGFSGLTLSADTNVTDVDIDDVHMQSIRMKSGSGSLRVRGVYTKYLSMDSDSGSVFCLLPGRETDYDISIRTNQPEAAPPVFHGSNGAGRKILLRSDISLPELNFTYEPLGDV